MIDEWIGNYSPFPFPLTHIYVLSREPFRRTCCIITTWLRGHGRHLAIFFTIIAAAHCPPWLSAGSSVPLAISILLINDAPMKNAIPARGRYEKACQYIYAATGGKLCLHAHLIDTHTQRYSSLFRAKISSQSCRRLKIVDNVFIAAKCGHQKSELIIIFPGTLLKLLEKSLKILLFLFMLMRSRLYCRIL